MKAFTKLIRIRNDYESAYIRMLQQYYKLTNYVNAYITHSTRYKDYHSNVVNAYILTT